MLGFKKRVKPRYFVRYDPGPEGRYSVQCVEAFPSIRPYVILDALHGEYIFRGHYDECEAQARALNRKLGLQVEERYYVFDTVTGEKVFQNNSSVQCHDRADVLNRSYREAVRARGTHAAATKSL